MNIREQIVAILEKNTETDWGFNGEDEVPYTVFDAEAAANELEELWKSNTCKG
jgi:hypothetical protein